MQHFWGKFKLIHILNDHAWLIHSNQLPVSVIPNECVYLSAASVSLIWIRSFVGTEDAVLTGYWSHLPNIHKVPESQLLVADVRRDPCVVPHLAGFVDSPFLSLNAADGHTTFQVHSVLPNRSNPPVPECLEHMSSVGQLPSYAVLSSIQRKHCAKWSILHCSQYIFRNIVLQNIVCKLAFIWHGYKEWNHNDCGANILVDHLLVCIGVLIHLLKKCICLTISI